jgi:flagellar biosynthetic protein FliS
MTDTNAAQQAHWKYTESRILSAQPVELVQMLHQLAINKLKLAITLLKDGDALGRSLAVSKAQGAVTELTVALDHSVNASFSRRLAELYGYIQRQIVKGHSERSEPAFREALSILTTLWEGWSKVSAYAADGATIAAAADESPVTAAGMVPSGPCSEYSRSFSVAGQSRDWSC